MEWVERMSYLTGVAGPLCGAAWHDKFSSVDAGFGCPIHMIQPNNPVWVYEKTTRKPFSMTRPFTLSIIIC